MPRYSHKENKGRAGKPVLIRGKEQPGSRVLADKRYILRHEMPDSLHFILAEVFEDDSASTTWLNVEEATALRDYLTEVLQSPKKTCAKCFKVLTPEDDELVITLLPKLKIYLCRSCWTDGTSDQFAQFMVNIKSGVYSDD